MTSQRKKRLHFNGRKAVQAPFLPKLHARLPKRKKNVFTFILGAIFVKCTYSNFVNVCTYFAQISSHFSRVLGDFAQILRYFARIFTN